MEIIELAGNIFSQKIGGNGDDENIVNALTGLFSDSDGGINIMNLISKFQSGGVTSLVTSWISDGENSPISSDQLKDIFGEEKISEFASNAGMNVDTAIDGLSGMIPDLIDQASNSESLLDNVGGIGGLADMAKKFF